MEETITVKQAAFLAKNKIDTTNMSKQDAHRIIAELLNKSEVVAPVVKPGISNDAYKALMAEPKAPAVDQYGNVWPKKSSSQSSYFVAYAKDMFIAIYEKSPVDNKIGLMQDCIEMIKIAKEQL